MLSKGETLAFLKGTPLPTLPPVFNRVRERNQYEALPCQVQDTLTGSLYTFTGYVPSRVEMTRDVVGLPKVNGRFISKPVRHNLVTYVPVQDHTYTGVHWLPYAQRTRPAPDISPATLAWMVGWSPPLETVSEVDFAQKAFDRFADQFPQALDFGNFLFEWNSVTELIPKMEKSISKTVSGAHLSWSFGAAPFIGDLEALMSICQTVLKRIDWLRAHNNKTSRLRTTREIDVTPALPPVVTLGDPAWPLRRPGYSYTAQLALRRVKLSATCRLHMALDIPEDLEAVTRGLIAALGLNNPLGTIWNSLPFSFVLDWIWKFGDVLDRHKYNTYIGDYLVDDFTVSFKETRDWVVYYNFKEISEADVDRGLAAWSYHTDKSVPIGHVIDTRYHRNVGWTYSDFPVLTFPPSAGSAVLAASLLRGLT